MDILEIGLVEDIGKWGFTLPDFVAQTKGFAGDKIVVPINSYGGEILEGLAIYNVLKGYEGTIDVETRIIGYAMSMGSIIAMAGTTVSMPENGYFMIHEPWGGAVGDAEGMQKNADLLESMAVQLAKIYQAKTKLSYAKIRAMMKEETWLTAKEAKELGFVNKVTKGAKFEAKFDPTKYKNAPKLEEEIIQNKEKEEMGAIDKVKEWFASAPVEVKEEVKAVIEGKTEEVVAEEVKEEVVDETKTDEAVETPTDEVKPTEEVKEVEPKVETETKVESTAETTVLAKVDAQAKVLDSLQAQMATLTTLIENQAKANELLKEESEIVKVKNKELSTKNADLETANKKLSADSKTSPAEVDNKVNVETVAEKVNQNSHSYYESKKAKVINK